MPQSGKAVPRSRLFFISSVYFPNARSIFLLKCSLRSLIESMSFSSWNLLLRLKELRFSSRSLSSFTILSILSSEIFGDYRNKRTWNLWLRHLNLSKILPNCTKFCNRTVPSHTEGLKHRGRTLDQLLSFCYIPLNQSQRSWFSFCMHRTMPSDWKLLKQYRLALYSLIL